MAFVWDLNLDAELELERKGYNRSARLALQLQEYLAAARQRLLGPEDRVLGEALPAARGAMIGRAWCPTPRAVGRLRDAGVAVEPHPPGELLKRVNHRRFAWELGAGPPGALWISDPEELERALARPGSWLLKRPLGFAGRGQLKWRGTKAPAERAWLAASLAADGLVLEPLLEIEAEFSVHGFAWRDGRYELGRPCLLLTEHGAFRGARLAGSDDLGATERAALAARADDVARALLAQGYFGPFGIDAYRYRASARLGAGFCALSEINARYTMAFDVGFARHPSQLEL